jgi:CRISPR-associated protein Cmr5
MQTLDQQYSACAYKHVLAIKGKENDKKYGAMAYKLPILIHTAGLVQALEFVNSRGTEVQQRLLEHLAETLGQKDAETLLETVRGAQLGLYIRLTRQILAALLWYKRFAQSLLDVDGTISIEEDGTDNDQTN